MALAIMLAYLAALVGLGVWSGRVVRPTTGDYYLASRNLGAFLLLMSIFGTTMTGFAIIGSSGETFARGIGVYGLMASWSGIIHSACFFLVGARVWLLGKKYGYLTQISFFRDRFRSEILAIVLFVMMSLFVLIYILVGVISGGRVVEVLTQETFPLRRHLTEVPLREPIGPVAIPPAWQDRVRIDQAGKLLVVQGSLGRHRKAEFLRWDGSEGWRQAVEELFAQVPHGGVPYSVATAVICLIVLFYVFVGGMRATAWANAFQTILSLIAGFVIFGVIVHALGGPIEATQRVLSQPEAAKRLAREGLIGRVEFTTYCFIPLSVAMFPHLFQQWLTARRAESFRLTVVAHPIGIMLTWLPCVLIGMWATGVLPLTTDPNAVLASMVHRFSGPVLGGILGAGVLAAILSGLDAQFLCLSTMFTNDILGRYVWKERLSDRARVYLGRLFVAVWVALAYGVALVAPTPVFPLGVWCFSGFAALFPLVIGALYWPRANKYGALACVSTVLWLWCWWLDEALAAGREEHEFLIGGVLPAAYMTVAAAAALVLVSWLTPPPPAELVARFFSAPQRRPNA